MACQEVATDPNADPAALRGIHVAIRTVKTMLLHWFWKHFLSPPARDREFCPRGVALGRHGVQEVSATVRQVPMDPNADTDAPSRDPCCDPDYNDPGLGAN